MLYIDDMTLKQKAMLDKIWECKSAAEFVTWRSKLSKNDQIEAMCLLELLQLAAIDSEIEETHDYTIAQKLLAEVMTKEG